MIVMILERVPASLRGELSRWLIEPRTGVFVGHLSAEVRDRLWAKCCEKSRAGGVVQVWSTNNEQRFRLRTFGDTTRQLIEMEGLTLIRIPHDLAALADGSIIEARLKRLADATTSASSSSPVP